MNIFAKREKKKKGTNSSTNVVGVSFFDFSFGCKFSKIIKKRYEFGYYLGYEFIL